MFGGTNAMIAPTSKRSILAPRDGLVAEWLFENMSEDLAFDTSGNDYHLEIMDCENPNGHIGKCLYFDGNSTEPVAGISTSMDEPLLDDFGDFTISFWMKLDPHQEDYRAIIRGLRDEFEPIFSFVTGYSDSEVLLFRGWEDKLISIKPNQWNHFILMRAGDQYSANFYLYVNGEQLANDPYIDNHSIRELWMGIDNSWGLESGSGSIDNLRIYNRMFSEAEILKLYNETGS